MKIHLAIYGFEDANNGSNFGFDENALVFVNRGRGIIEQVGDYENELYYHLFEISDLDYLKFILGWLDGKGIEYRCTYEMIFSNVDLSMGSYYNGFIAGRQKPMHKKTLNFNVKFSELMLCENFTKLNLVGAKDTWGCRTCKFKGERSFYDGTLKIKANHINKVCNCKIL